MNIKDLYAELLDQPVNHDNQETDFEIISRIRPKLEEETKKLIAGIDKKEIKKIVENLENYYPAIRITIQSSTTWKLEVGVAQCETSGCWEFYQLNSGPFIVLTSKKLSPNTLKELFPNEEKHVNISSTLDQKNRVTFYFR